MTNQSRTILSFYCTGGLREIIPIYPLYAIMFSEHGVSPFELSMLFATWALVGLLTEVPSGAWADTYSRKWLVVSAGFLKSLAFISWFLWQDFYGYALGFILWGFGSSLRSGAFEALLHDLLREWDSAEKFTEHYGRIKAIATASIILGELLGGLLIVRGYDFVLLISALIPVLASLPFIFFVSDAAKDEFIAEPDYWQHLKSGLNEATINPSIRFIFFAATFLLIAQGVLDEYEPPLLFEKGFDLSVIAYLAAPIYGAEAIGQYLAGRFTYLNFRQLLWLMIIGTGFMLPMPWLSGFWVPASIAMFCFMFGLASTVFAGRLQQNIQGASRATVTSLIGFGDSLGAIIWFMIFGGMAEFTSMSDATFGFALLIILLAFTSRKLLVIWNINR